MRNKRRNRKLFRLYSIFKGTENESKRRIQFFINKKLAPKIIKYDGMGYNSFYNIQDPTKAYSATKKDLKILERNNYRDI